MKANNKLISNAPCVSVIEPSYIETRLDASYYAPVAIKTYEKVINSGLPWKSVKKSCSKINSGPFGSSLLASQYVETGVPFFRPLNIKNIIAETSQLVFISEEDWARLRSSQFVEGDILITKIGNGIGDVGVLPDGVKKANISGNLMGIRLKPQYNSYFAVTYFKSTIGQILISRALTNTAKPKLGSYDLVNIPIILPDSKIQDYIGQKVKLAEKCREKADTILFKAKELINELYGDSFPEKSEEKHNVISAEDLTTDRMDAWFYQLNFMNLKKYLLANRRFVPLAEIAKIRNRRIGSLKQEDCDQIDYIEISSIDVESSLIKPNRKKISDLPASAKKELHFGDVLASTVRVNRKCISVVPFHFNKSIGSTAIAVLKTPSIEEAHFLELILKHDISTSQIMRWNTGSVYPTVTEDVFEKILIPNICQDERKKIGRIGKLSASYRYKAVSLILKAKSDVEALIEGKLDTDAILSGKIKAPTWEDIEKELEGI